MLSSVVSFFISDLNFNLVESTCCEGNTAESPVFTFTTPERDYPEFENCGAESSSYEITNYEPLADLLPGDVFTAGGGHQITVTQASGSNGHFTGTGYTRINFMGNMKVAVQFKDISINTDFQLYGSGVVETTYNPSSGGIYDVDEVVDNIKDEVAGGNDQGGMATTEDLVDLTIGVPVVDKESVQLNTSTGELVVTVGTGTYTYDVSSQVSSGEPFTIQDSNGDVYTADPKTGTIGKMGTVDRPGYLADGGDNKTVTGDVAIVRFTASDQSSYAFDPHAPVYTSDFNDSEYRDATITIAGKTENVPFQLIPAGKSSTVKVNITATAADFDASKIIYRTVDKSQEYRAPDNRETQELTLKAGKAGESIELHALYPANEETDKYTLLGKLIIATYQPISKNVKLVLLDNPKISISEIENKLQSVYTPYGITLNITNGSFPAYRQYLGADNTLDVTETGRFTRYSSEMKSLNKGYKANSGDYNSDAFYVFILPTNKVTINENIGPLSGDMPRGKQFGYVFYDGQSPEELTQTIAHELGHGLFKLQHTFSDSYKIAEGTTENLMDYNRTGGTELIKPQWDMLYDTGIAGFWDDDEEGAAYDDSRLIVKANQLPVESGPVSFLSPAGLPVSFSDVSKLESVYVSSISFDAIDNQKIGGQLLSFVSADKGVLIAFKYDGDFYVPVFETVDKSRQTGFVPANTIFRGYKSARYYDANPEGKEEFKVYQYDSGQWNEFAVCYNPEKYYNGTKLNREGYRAAGYMASYLERRLSNGCSDYMSRFKDLDFLDFIESEIYAKYNPWGMEGYLQQIRDRNGDVRLIYSLEENGWPKYFEYDYIYEDWLEWELTSVELAQIIDRKFLSEVCSLYGHQSLDIIGFVPVVGEVADVINGVWYLVFEQDATNATLCFGSILVPIVGDFTAKGTKYIVKGLKATGLTREIRLTYEGLESLSSLERLLKSSGELKCKSCLNVFANILEEVPDHGSALIKLAESIRDEGKLEKVIAKIDKLPVTPTNFKSSLLSDLADNSNFADKFIEKVTDNPELVESWKVLSDAGVPNLSNKLDDIEFIGKYLDEIKGAGGYKAWRDVAIQADNVSAFSKLTSAQKLENIKNIWNTKYPIEDMLGGRSFFEDIMGEYRYTKASGWEHTGDISFNVKGIDFYKGAQQGSEIYASTAVSMKTTIQTNVETWLKYPSIQDNIKFLRQGLSDVGMVDKNNSLRMFIENAEIHIYMKKANITPSLETQWLNKLNTDYPDIKFEIKAIEDFLN